jgi:DNA-binding Xre family transcriptional regulator
MNNQAVLFTKPVHHLGIPLSAEELGRRALDFFSVKGFSVVHKRTVTGTELAEREIIRRHYLMYSKASYGDIEIADTGRKAFAEYFAKQWDAEVAAGRIMGNPQLLETKGIDAPQLFTLWNTATVKKIQTGLLIAWLDALDCWCVNAFYPAMEANFYHPATRMDYYVVEFDPVVISWQQFRKDVLGSTNAAKAAPESFRGQLYAEYPVEFPGRDNFVHGSAGPFEGLIERAVHESDFQLADNPVGRWLEERGIALERFRLWKRHCPNIELGKLFDATEEKDTVAVLPLLETVVF